MTSETIKTEDDAVKFTRLDIWASFGEFKLTTLKLQCPNCKCPNLRSFESDILAQNPKEGF